MSFLTVFEVVSVVCKLLLYGRRCVVRRTGVRVIARGGSPLKSRLRPRPAHAAATTLRLFGCRLKQQRGCSCGEIYMSRTARARICARRKNNGRTAGGGGFSLSSTPRCASCPR